MKIRRHHKKAFSMIELSIAILIISVIAVGFISISQSTKQTSRASSDIEKINKIYKAITSFVSANKRLPCPALLTVTKGDNAYGVEGTTPGTCSEFETASGEVVYGMIPFRVLGISQEDVEDAQGTRFSYIVDRRFTKKTSGGISSTDGFEITRAMPFVNSSGQSSSTPEIVLIQNPRNNIVMSNALFAIVGHGENRSGGWPATASFQNISVTSDEDDNRGRSTNVVGMVHDRDVVAGSTQSGFDDIVLYKNKAELVRDAGLINMMCSGYELIPPSGSCQSSSWSSPSIKNSYHLGITTSNMSNGVGCISRCGDYGVWDGSLTYLCGPPAC